MSVGDLKNNLEKLRSDLRVIKYPDPVDIKGLTEGNPIASLPIIHYVMLSFSKSVAEFIIDQGYDLLVKSDHAFIDTVYKLLRQKFGYRPALSMGQFLTIGYAERKILFCTDVIKIFKNKHKELLRFKKALDTKTKFKPEEEPQQIEPPKPLPNEIIANYTSILKDSVENSPKFEESPVQLQEPKPTQTDTKQIYDMLQVMDNRLTKLESNFDKFSQQVNAKIHLLSGNVKFLESRLKETSQEGTGLLKNLGISSNLSNPLYFECTGS